MKANLIMAGDIESRKDWPKLRRGTVVVIQCDREAAKSVVKTGRLEFSVLEKWEGDGEAA